MRLVCISIFSLLLLTPFVYAQELDDIIVEDDVGTQQASQTPESFRLGKYFSGEALGSYSGLISDDARYNFDVRLRYAQSWEKAGLSVVVSGNFYTSSVDLSFEETDHRQFPSVTTTNSVTTDTTKAELREGYIRYSKGPIDVYAGRRIIAIGQFDAFSPVDFLLPVNLSDSRVSFSKLENKYPQTAISMHIYLLPQIELQGYWFPRIERDPISKNLFEQGQIYQDRSGAGLPVERQVPFQKPNDESQWLFRAVYTGQKITAGVTYYKGYNLFAEDRTVLGKETATGNLINNFRIPEPSYPEQSGIGLEIAVPHNRFTFKYEVLMAQEYVDFRHCSDSNSPDCTAYHARLNTELDGRAYTNQDFLAHAIGFDYLGDTWVLNIALFNVLDVSSSATKSLVDESDRIANDDPESGVLLFPTINIARSYGKNNGHTTGFGAGALGSVIGGTVYHRIKVSDNLQLAGSFEAFQYQSDFQTEEARQADLQQSNEQSSGTFDVVKSNDFSLALRLGFIYSF